MVKPAKEDNMTVFEILKQKYMDRLANMWPNDMKRIEEYSASVNQHPAKTMFMALEITEHDIKRNGGYTGELYAEIREMHQSKLLASNKHRQEYGHVDAYWLTQKGFNYLNKKHSIC